MKEGNEVEHQSLERVVTTWWAQLQADSAGRSSLRRCGTIDRVLLTPQFYELLRSVQRSGHAFRVQSLAIVAGVAVHIREDMPSTPFGAHCATTFSEGKSGELRFRRLLMIDDGASDELLGSMIRVVRLLGSRVNIADVARKLVWWNERSKRELGYDFYTNFSSKNS